MKSILWVLTILLGYAYGVGCGVSHLGSTRSNPTRAYFESMSSSSKLDARRLEQASEKVNLSDIPFYQKLALRHTNAAAAYNDWTNTLVLPPEMTTADQKQNITRIRSLVELRAAKNELEEGPIGTAAIVFHELSHAEWDVFVESSREIYDRKLLEAMTIELERILESSESSRRVSLFNRKLLGSETFAYYREKLIATLLSNSSEILAANGLEPDTLNCAQKPLRRFKDPRPLRHSYRERVHVDTVWAGGEEVDLTVNPEAHVTLNQALFDHSTQSMSFSNSRDSLFKKLKNDPKIHSAWLDCRRLHLVR